MLSSHFPVNLHSSVPLQWGDVLNLFSRQCKKFLHVTMTGTSYRDQSSCPDFSLGLLSWPAHLLFSHPNFICAWWFRLKCHPVLFWTVEWFCRNCCFFKGREIMEVRGSERCRCTPTQGYISVRNQVPYWQATRKGDRCVSPTGRCGRHSLEVWWSASLIIVLGLCFL